MDYAKTAKRVIAMIEKYGQVVTWRKPGNAVQDQNQPWKTVAPAEPNDTQVKIVFVSQGDSTLNALFHLIKGTDAVTGAPYGLMAPQSFTPEITDTVIRDDGEQSTDDVMVIASIDTVNPGGVPLLHIVRFA